MSEMLRALVLPAGTIVKQRADLIQQLKNNDGRAFAVSSASFHRIVSRSDAVNKQTGGPYAVDVQMHIHGRDKRSKKYVFCSDLIGV